MAQNTKEMLSLTTCTLIIMFCNKVKRDAKKVLLINFFVQTQRDKIPEKLHCLVISPASTQRQKRWLSPRGGFLNDCLLGYSAVTEVVKSRNYIKHLAFHQSDSTSQSFTLAPMDGSLSVSQIATAARGLDSIRSREETAEWQWRQQDRKCWH